MNYTRNITLPFGTFHMVSDGTAITALYTGAVAESNTCPLLEEAARQLTAYTNGTRQSFDLPVAPVGSAFQQAVWSALQTIPYGQTRTYGQIAAQIGKPKAARAVGGACNKNPVLMVIPCHRVIGADGSMTGFGAGIALKETLLRLEKRSI